MAGPGMPAEVAGIFEGTSERGTGRNRWHARPPPRPGADDVTLGQAADAYLATLHGAEQASTRRTYGRILRWVVTEFGSDAAPDIDPERFAVWFTAVGRPGTVDVERLPRGGGLPRWAWSPRRRARAGLGGAARDDDVFRAGRLPAVAGDRFEGERAWE